MQFYFNYKVVSGPKFPRTIMTSCTILGRGSLNIWSLANRFKLGFRRFDHLYLQPELAIQICNKSGIARLLVDLIVHAIKKGEKVVKFSYDSIVYNVPKEFHMGILYFPTNMELHSLS